MTRSPEPPEQQGAWVQPAEGDDLAAVGRLLHAFNVEYGEPTPGPQALTERVGELVATGDTVVLLAGAGARPAGLVLLRFRPALWSSGAECYVAELYVAPEQRGHGLGRTLMESALQVARERGADYIHLSTGENDVVARTLYERMGFHNTEGIGGQVTYSYERDL